MFSNNIIFISQSYPITKVFPVTVKDVFEIILLVCRRNMVLQTGARSREGVVMFCVPKSLGLTLGPTREVSVVADSCALSGKGGLNPLFCV